MNRRIACQPIQIRTECGKQSTGVFLGNTFPENTAIRPYSTILASYHGVQKSKDYWPPFVIEHFSTALQSEIRRLHPTILPSELEEKAIAITKYVAQNYIFEIKGYPVILFQNTRVDSPIPECNSFIWGYFSDRVYIQNGNQEIPAIIMDRRPTFTDMLYLRGETKLDNIDLIRPVPDDYQLTADSKITICVFRGNQVEELSVSVSEPHFKSVKDEPLASIPILNVIVSGQFEPGDSGAPAIIEHEGLPYLLGTLNFGTQSLGEIILVGQAEDRIVFGEDLPADPYLGVFPPLKGPKKPIPTFIYKVDPLNNRKIESNLTESSKTKLDTFIKTLETSGLMTAIQELGDANPQKWKGNGDKKGSLELRLDGENRIWIKESDSKEETKTSVAITRTYTVIEVGHDHHKK